jgi:hypothetical protein
VWLRAKEQGICQHAGDLPNIAVPASREQTRELKSLQPRQLQSLQRAGQHSSSIAIIKQIVG